MNLNVINASQSWILRSASQHQTSTGLLWQPPPMVIGGTTVHRKGATIVRYDLQNRAAGTYGMGIGFRYRNAIWQFGRLSADNATYTDLTSSAQSSSTTATLQVAGADQTGFAIGCTKPIGWFSVNITTAETNAGGATVVDHAVKYSKGAALSDATSGVAILDDFTADNTVLDAAVHNFVWMPPADWTPSAALGGLPDGYYWLVVTSAHREADDVAAVATGVECGSLYCRESVADNGILAAEKVQYYEPDADAVVAFFQTANAGNAVYAEVLA